jgi:hypothetical protein
MFEELVRLVGKHAGWAVLRELATPSTQQDMGAPGTLLPPPALPISAAHARRKWCVNSTQVYVNSTQVYVNSTQVYVNSTQVYVNSTQVYVNSTQMYVNSTQVLATGGVRRTRARRLGGGAAGAPGGGGCVSA